MVMKYFDPSLKKYVKFHSTKKGGLEYNKGIELFIKIAKAVNVIHEKVGYVWADLKSENMRKKLLGGFTDKGSLLIYVGRLSAEKQIERIKPVLDALPDTRLALVGDGPYRSQLEKIFENTAIQEEKELQDILLSLNAEDIKVELTKQEKRLELYKRINCGITFINLMIGYMRSIGNELIH